ncbi:Sm-like protein LSM1B [Sesamum angolense]|uniref:Sm-like protein LSM1B n=2 Tax=Sesamum TaxID=4181 RepID=A0AAE1WKJ1_9LAMI|nr:Sm-like protein LSM1B [Sesamum angolense]
MNKNNSGIWWIFNYLQLRVCVLCACSELERSGTTFAVFTISLLDQFSTVFACKMKFFNWMQSKFNGGQGDKRSNAVPATNHTKKEPPKEEFSDWPRGLLAIGTFGNTDLRDRRDTQVEQNAVSEVPQADECSSPDFSEFTAEEVGKLQKELTKLLSRKPATKAEEPIADLPLDRFLNCPSSLEVDRTTSNRFSTYSDDKDEEEIDRTIRIILGRCKDVCEKKKKAIGKKSLSFLVKKMFACRSGFGPTPSLRDTFQESRMEKLMRTMLTKKIYSQSSSRSPSSKKYIEDCRSTSTAEREEEAQDKGQDGSKWVRLILNYRKSSSLVLSSSMSWAGLEDVYLSTSLASYLDRKLLVLLRDGRKLLGTLRSFDQFANAVLEGACERVIVGELYCDIPLGLYVIRGENVVLIGELDSDKEELPPHMTRVSTAEIRKAQKADREASELKGTMKRRMDFLDMD